MKNHTPDRQQTLERIINDTGLTVENFATAIIGREERTVRRWLKHETPVPNCVDNWLKKWERLSTETRRRIIGALTKEKTE